MKTLEYRLATPEEVANRMKNSKDSVVLGRQFLVQKNSKYTKDMLLADDTLVAMFTLDGVVLRNLYSASELYEKTVIPKSVLCDYIGLTGHELNAHLERCSYPYIFKYVDMHQPREHNTYKKLWWVITCSDFANTTRTGMIQPVFDCEYTAKKVYREQMKGHDAVDFYAINTPVVGEYRTSFLRAGSIR